MRADLQGMEVTDLIPVRSVWRRRDAYPPQRRLLTTVTWAWVTFIPVDESASSLGHGACSVPSLLDNFYMESAWCRISVMLPDGAMA